MKMYDIRQFVFVFLFESIKKVKLSLYLTSEALRHEGVWGVDV
jgi:hypothetical protein